MSEERAQRLPIHISMEDPEPMYRQIESQLRDFILSGVLKPGTKLPSMRALAHDVSVSVITTRRAYEDLEAEGLLRTRPGLGTLVAEIPEEKMSAHRHRAVYSAFREAVRVGRRAGLSEVELREILEESLQAEDANFHQEVRGGTS